MSKTKVLAYNATQIAEEVARELDLPHAEVRRVLDKTFETILKRVYEKPVSIRGFGRFEARTMRPKKVRNPQDGSTFLLPSQVRLRITRESL